MRHAACIVLVGVLALVGGGCRKVMSEQVVEATAEDLLFTIAGVEVQVDCPAGVTMRAQEDFFCRTSIADRRGHLLVRQLDDYGRVEFERERPLDPSTIEPLVARFLRTQYDVDAVVSCPGEVIQEPDENFRCAVRGTARCSSSSPPSTAGLRVRRHSPGSCGGRPGVRVGMRP